MLQTALEEAKAQNKAAEEPDEEKETLRAQIVALKKKSPTAHQSLSPKKGALLKKQKVRA